MKCPKCRSDHTMAVLEKVNGAMRRTNEQLCLECDCLFVDERETRPRTKLSDEILCLGNAVGLGLCSGIFGIMAGVAPGVWEQAMSLLLSIGSGMAAGGLFVYYYREW